MFLGNFTEDITLLGTGLQIGAGIFNLDLLMDIRDLTADFCNWEWSWGHLAQTTLDVVGLLPVVGVLKYGDEAFTLAKHGDELALAGGDVLKYADDVSEEALKAGKNITPNASTSEKIVETTEEAIKGGKKTNFDNEIPRSGAEWNEYFKGKYGADNVQWNINSVDDIFSDPTRLKGYTADELQTVLGSDWTRGVYGSNGGGWKLMNGDISIFYHPGGGKHGGSYYGISSGTTGKIKVVNPETYIPLKGDKATVIYD